MAGRTSKAAEKSAEVRCIACGKPIETADPAAQMVLGHMDEGHEFDAEKVFGTLHRACFDRTIESPRSVLDEIKRLSKRGSSLRA